QHRREVGSGRDDHAGLHRTRMRGCTAALIVLALCAAVPASTGIIETIAGGGVGDGLPATEQALETYRVAVDAAGNVYVSEGFRDRVRRVDALTGLISTIAGNGQPGV